MYKSSGFKKIKLSKYTTNLKLMISQRKLFETPILILYLLFLFFIDLIPNIIYTSVLLDQKFHPRDLSLRFSKFYIYELMYNFNTV